MTPWLPPEVGALLQLLLDQGLVAEDAGDGVVMVAPRGRTGPETTLELPENLLVTYLDAVGRSYAPFDDDPPPRPATGDAPHDDPGVFAAELEALVAFLRDQGIDVVADPDGAALRLTGGDEPVTLALRPDLYRRWFEAAQEEFEAIGGDPREYAWRLWCRTVARLPACSPATRVGLVASPDGEVLLRPDEPSRSPYVWSADPGT